MSHFRVLGALFGGTKPTKVPVATGLHCPNDNKRKVSLNGVDDDI